MESFYSEPKLTIVRNAYTYIIHTTEKKVNGYICNHLLCNTIVLHDFTEIVHKKENKN